jgi:hypothetical protein
MIARAAVLAVLACLPLNATATLWRDCAAEENITGKRLHFDNIVSNPDPLHTGETQYITKQGTSDLDLPTNITSTFSQYWCFADCHDKNGDIKWKTGLPWIRFLKINVDVCKDHPDMCPLRAGQHFNTTAKHPKLNPLTPHGWYRSRQIYHNGDETVGCADMIIEYVSKAKEEDQVFSPLATPLA